MPNPRKKYTIEEARAFAKKNPKQFNAALDKINPDPYRGTKKLADLLIKQYPERYKDYKPEDFISMLDSISKVESGNQNIAQKSINPKTKKAYDGPARGYFQIETNTAPTASKRYQNYQDILKKATAVPLPDIQVPKSGDVRSLSKDEQARLALSNMSATAASRKQSLNPLNSQDSWLNYHWNGSETEKPARQNHWKETFGYEDGGQIEPTRADSLDLLNNTKSLENYYSKYNKSYSSAQDASEVNVHALNKNSADTFFTSGASVKVPRKDGTSMDLQRELFPKDQYYKKIDNNRYYQRELADRILDTRAPMALYDKRIAPNNLTAYLNDIPNDGMNGDGITIYGYDPLSVTPWDMLNSKDKANRISQFGVAGTPYKSVEEFQKANPAPVIQARKNNLEKMPIINKPLSINNNQQINPDSNVTVPKFQPYTASNNPNIAKGYYDLGQGKKIETFQDGGRPPLYGLGGTIGSLLSTAAPIASLIPGVGTAVGVGAGILGAGLQALDGPSGGSQGGSPQRGVPMHHMSNYAPTGFARGGETGLVPINIEGHNVKNISMSQAKKGELLVHQGRVHKNYISRPPHPSEGQNPLGNDEVAQGLIVIPKDRSTEYLNANTGLRKQIERSIVSQQVAREGNKMRKGGQAGRSKMLPGGMAEDYFDREYPYAPSLNPHVGYAQVEQVGNHYMEGDAYRNARAGLPASYNNMSPMTPRDPFNSGYDQNIRTQMSNNNNNPGPRGSIYNRTDGGTPGEQDSGMSSFDKLNLGQFGLSMIPAIGDIIDATASVQTPQFGSLRNVSPNLIDPNTGQSQINQAYRSGYNSLRDSGVYSLKSNRNLVADRMQRSGDQALNIANQNAQIKNQFVGMNTDINKYNLDMQNQVELYRMQGQAKRREARRNLLDRAPAAASQYMQNGLYAKMLGI